MIGKNNQYLKNKKEGTKVETYSIKKFKVGTASVVIGASIFFGAGAVAQASEEVSNNTTSDNTTNSNASEGVAAAPVATAQPVAKEATKEDVASAVAAKLSGETAQEVKALDKTKLENYIAEIEAKLANGTYESKTEESVAVLKEALKVAKDTLENAKTQEELTKAYNKLVTTANTKLKAKPVEKKETPAVDTTNGQPTVGKKAENTEKKSESNLIENTGSNDPRNGKALDKNNAFRAEVAYSEGTNAAANGHSDAYILNDVNKATSTDDAVNAVSRVTNYKVKYNKDASGKITSLDWLVFYNDHAENLANAYNTDGGDVYRNFIQIPAEVNMPTSITRAKYNSPVNPKFINGKVQRIRPDGSALSNSVTFENPAPATAAGLPLDKKDAFALNSGWESTLYGRSIEKLAGQEDRYFKSAASNSSPRTKELIYGAALNDKRLIVDRSTTGGDGNDAYAWSFRTEVPKTTTNEQLKDMKVVFGMMRSATAGANAGFANIATNPIKMWKSDVYTPTAKDQTVKVGQKPDATKSIGNLDTLPKGTTVKYKDAVDTRTPGEKRATAVVTYPDTSTKEVPVKVIVEKEAVAPAKPVITTSLTGKANTKTPVEVKAEAGSTVALFDKDNNKIGEATAGNNGVASITPTKDIPAGNVKATATKNGKTSQVSDAVVATPAAVTPQPATPKPSTPAPGAATNKPAAGAATSAPEIVNDLAGKASTPADVTVKAPAGSTVKLYNTDGVVIGEAVANAQGVATVHPTNSLPAGEITATSTPAGGKESAKSTPITVTKTPLTIKDGGTLGNNNTRLYVSKTEITVYPGDKIDVDVEAKALDNTGLEKFSVEKNPTAINGVLPSGGYLGSSNGATVTKRNAKYSGTVAMDQPAGTTEVVFHAKNRDKPTTIFVALTVNVLETAKKYEPVAGTKVDVANSNGVSETEKNKIIEAVKTANPSLPANSQYSVDEKGNLTITYPDGSKDKIAAAYLVNPAAPVVAPTVEIPYSNAAKRQIYVYTGENTDLTFTGKDETTVKDLYLRGPGGVTNDNATQYGFTVGKIDNGAVTNGEGTVSADKRTATIKMTGVTTLKAPNQWTSFIEAKDSDDAKSMTGADYNASTDDAVRQQKPGYVQFVVKSQTDKYDIKTPTEKVTVADSSNVTDADLAKIKEKLQLEYKKDNDDANIAKDTPVDKDGKIKSVTKDNKGNLVVTYTDGSQDKKPLSEFVVVAPTVEIPYSNAAKRQIYVYTGENTDLTFTGKDETTVKDLYLRGPGGVTNDNATQYGFTVGKIDNGAVTNGEGTVSADKRTATIKMTGVTTLKAPNQWTSFIEAKDSDDAKSMTGADYNASTDDAVRQQKPGYVQFVVKSQTDKYDIKTPTEKVTVADSSNVTDADLAKIKEKLQLEYKKDNDDANIAKDTPVDKDGKIKSVTKDNKGNLVVTYTDGSQDKKPLSEFVTKKPTDADKNTPKAKLQIVDKGTTPKAEDSIGNVKDLPKGTKVAFKDPVDTATPGKKDATVVVTYPDGSKEEVPVKVTVKDPSSALTDADKNTPTGKPQTVNKGTTPKAEDSIENVKDLPKGTKVAFKDPVDTATPGKKDATVVVTYPDGSKEEVPVKVTVKDPSSALTDADKNTPTGKPQTVNKGTTPKAEDSIENVKDLPKGTKVAFKDPVDTATPGEKDATVVVTYPDGSKEEVPVKVTVKDPSSAPTDADKNTPTGKPQTVNKGTTPKAEDSIGNVKDLPKGTKVAFKDPVDTATPGEKDATVVVTYPDGSKEEVPVKVTVKAPSSTPDTKAPAKPEIKTDLTDKAGTKTPVEVSAEPGSKVELFDKNGNKIGEGVADENGKATITPTVELPAGDVTAKATDSAGNVSEPSTPEKATADTKAPAKPEIKTDLTDKAGTKTPVEVSAEPGAKVELFDKDGNKIGEGVADENGKATITPTKELPAGDVTAKATDPAGNVSEASTPAKATKDTQAPSKPEIKTDLTDKAGTKTPVEVTAEPGAKVELFDKDGNKIGEGVADENGKATITPTKELPAGDVTAKATDPAGNVSEASTPAKATKDTQAPSKPEIKTDLTDKAGTKTPVEVTAEPGAKVELFDKDGNKIGEGVADENGKATITPTKELPAGDVTAKATDPAGNVSEASTPAKATKDTQAPSKPEIKTDLTDKAGTKTPVEVTAEPGAKVELFDKDGNKIGEGVADENGKATITPTKELPAGDVTAKATDPAGNVSEASTPAKATKDTQAPSKPEIKTDLTDKAGTKTPVEVTAEPGAKVELFDKDGNKIGEGVADENGKATITPTKELPAGDVTAKATDPAGNVSEASTPAKATKDTQAPSKPEIKTDLTDKAGTKTPVEVTAEPGAKVELFDKDGNKIGEGVADENGKATITPTKELPAGDVTAKATDPAGNVSEASTPAKATKDTQAPSKPEIKTDLTDKAGTKTPVEVTAEPGAKVELFDKDGNKIGEGVAGKDGKATITPTKELPAGDVTAKATDPAGNVSEASTPAKATKDTQAPSKPEIKTDLTDKAGTKTPVEVTAEPGAKVELFDKDGNKIGEGVAGKDGKATITPTKELPEGGVTAKATDPAGNVSEPSEPAKATTATEVKVPEKTQVKDPSNLTDAEKEKVKEAVKKENPSATEVEVGKDGTVTVTSPDGSTVTIPGNKTVEPTTEVKVPEKTPVKDPSNLTDAEKEKVKEAVKKENPSATEVEVGKDGTVTVTSPDGSTVTIPGNKTVEPTTEVKVPEKTPVKDPSNLTDAEKEKVKEAVKKENPSATEVEVGKDGTVTVTSPDGSTVTIPGNKTVEPTTEVKVPEKTPVKDPSNLTDAEKEAVKEAVKKENPTATEVEVGKDGTVTVTSPDGSTVTIPGNKTVEPTTEVKVPEKTPVKDPSNLTDAEKEAVKEAVKKANPSATEVEVGKDGTVTVTSPDGSTVTIPGNKTVEPTTEVKVPEKTPVKDPSNLTDAEKEAVKEAVKKENPSATEVEVGKDGTVTVTSPDGSTVTIPGSKTVEEELKGGVKAPEKTPVKDPSNLTDAEKEKVKEAVKKANPTATEVEVGKDGTVTVTFPDGTKATIPGSKAVEEELKGGVKAPEKTPVKDPSNLTDAEKEAVKEAVKKANPTATEVEVGKDGTVTVTFPDGTKATIPGSKAVEEAPKGVKAPEKTPVKDPSNLTDAEKEKVKEAVKKANPTATEVEVGKDGTVTVTFPDGTKATIPGSKAVEEELKGGVKAPEKTPVKDPSNLTDAEKEAVKEAVKKANPTATEVEVGKDGTVTVTFPDGTKATIPGSKAVEEAPKGVKAPEKTPVKDPSNLTDAEKEKVKEAVKKANPTAKEVEVGKDGTVTVTFPDGTKATIPGSKAVEEELKGGVKAPEKTPVKDPSNLTDAEKEAVKEAVKKANPTATEVEVGKDGTVTVTFPDGTKATIPGSKAVEEAPKGVKAPEKTPVKDPSNLTDAEKEKVKEAVKKANPTATEVEVGKDGTVTVTFPDGTKATIPGSKAVEEELKGGVKAPEKTPVKDPSNLTDAEKEAVKEAVKKANPTATEVEVGKDGTVTVTFPDGTKATIPGSKAVEEAPKGVKAPEKTPVKDPSNLTDAEKEKVKEAVKKANPTATEVEVGKDETVTVTFPDGTKATIPGSKAVEEELKGGVKAPEKTPVKDPSNLTDAEKEAVKEAVKKANPTATEVEVGKDGTVTVTFPDGTKATIPGSKAVEEAPKGVKAPEKTPVKDPSNLTDAEKEAVKEAVKKANPTAKEVEVGKDGTVTVTFPDGTKATIPGSKAVEEELKGGVKAPEKTPVKDPSNLTDAEKEAVKEAVKKANPTATEVEVGKDGTVTVTFPDGTKATIPGSKAVEEAPKGVKAPEKTPVKDPSNLTDAEKEAVKEAVKKANPTATEVEVGKDGTVTVTFPDGTKATIPGSKAVEEAPKGVKAPEKTPVKDPSNLTDAEKEAAKAKIKGANADVVEVIFDKAGNATVITKDGKVYTIVAKDIFKQKEVPTLPGKVGVENVAKLTDAEKEAVKQALIAANPKLKDAKITIADNGEATIVYPDGQVVVIPANNLVMAKGSNGQGTNAKLEQRLANTGTTETNTGLAGLGLGILGGLLAAARRRKEK